MFAFVGWALCAAIMGVGTAITSMEITLHVHAIAAPIIFGSLAAIYFSRFNLTTPLQTAVFFTGFIIVMDFVVVAMLILHTTAMFESFEGTWLPFALIFTSTYLVGLFGRFGNTPGHASNNPAD